MTRPTKTGSSRRKGDEYQDLTALQLALEAYIDRRDFEVYIEYEKAGALDDVMVVFPDCVEAYQVKHAVSNSALYIPDDFTDPNSVVFLRKFARSWQKIAKEFPKRNLSVFLRSNRALDARLAKVITNKGNFDKKFLENRYRNETRSLRTAIFDSTELSEQEFQEFLRIFHFDLKRPSWLELEKYIQAVLLDHKLGISDRRVFADLKRLVERHAIEIADPITPKIVDSFLREKQSRYLLPQSFSVDGERFVAPPTLNEQLDRQLAQANGEYIVVTGPPGSGKSTALTQYCDELEENGSDRFSVVRYYCFVRINDNRQRLRLEATSLRANLLTEMQRKFSKILDSRRFDFGEDQFLAALEQVATHCQEGQRKLVVFLDGLDHVERDGEIRDSVIAGLPAEVPNNVVFLIGTQELSRWSPITLKEGREDRHVEMPLFSYDETYTYIVDRCALTIPVEKVRQLFEKSAGLPLYLRYLVQFLSSSDDPIMAVESIPAAVDGDVHSYYATLWAGFESDGRTDSRYLSSVFASLRFSVHDREIALFQKGIPDTPRFEAAYQRVAHLLRQEGNLVSIFHNSFRVFVLERTNAATRTEISIGIMSRLKLEELQSARWFKHAFSYAIEAGDFEYVIGKVNRKFVDAALICLRPNDEIADGIECGIDAAGATGNLVALSSIGLLKYRTHERMEYTFARSMLADALLYQGRIDQVVSSVYSESMGRIVANLEYSLGVILRLVELDHAELAEKLFNALRQDPRWGDKLQKHDIVTLARCAGAFGMRPKKVVCWLYDQKLRPDMLETEELSDEYAPHLAAYLEGLVRSGRENIWRRLRNLGSPFSNRLMRQLTIRAVANWGQVSQLRREIDAYVAAHPNEANLELAFHAVQSGLPSDVVTRLAGEFHFPSQRATGETLRKDLESQILRFAHWAVILEYEQNTTVVSQVRGRLPKERAVWTCMQLYLLKVGEVLGSNFADRKIDWFTRASEAIEALEAAGDVPEERTPDALDAARSMLDRSLKWLSAVVVKRCPSRVREWAELLKRLRSSFIWTTHYGIGEHMTDYTFEFSIWDLQADLPAMRGQIRPVLLDCGKSYEEALSLKGGARGDHFLALAALAAKCGFVNDAINWLQCGVQTSLAYGYRKDITLEKLTDILALLGEHRPALVLPNAAAILEMIKLVPYATDGRCTKHFAQYIFPVIMTHNRAAALEVLRRYYHNFARWQANESVIKYILLREDADPEFLWALCGLLDPNESVKSRQHVLAVAAMRESSNANMWESRFSDYIATMVNPRHWPDDFWDQATRRHDRPKRRCRGPNSALDNQTQEKYAIDGEAITVQEAVERCRSSFSEMVETLEKAAKENKHFPDYKIFEVLPEHIDTSTTTVELDRIRSFLQDYPQRSEAKFWGRLGDRYLDLGGICFGWECIERAIRENPLSGAFRRLVEYDQKRVEKFVVGNLTERLHGPEYHGFDAPCVAAHISDILGNVDDIGEIFNDYLQHCQDLFSQWPDDCDFDELRNWSDADRDEVSQIVHLLIDRLDAPATEFGRRLVYAISILAERRGEKIMPLIEHRLASADGLLLWRLVQIYVRLSYSNPSLFQAHCRALIPLLNRGDIFLALTVSRAIRSAFANSDLLSGGLKRSVDEIDRRYSSLISYRGFHILTTPPSTQFIKLIKNAAQLSFARELAAICEILSLDEDSVAAEIERRFSDTGITLEDVEEDARSIQSAFSHAQGWPIIWFASDFHVTISNLLYQTVSEVLEKRKYQQDHLEAVWRVIQQSDPEYCDSQLVPKPDDIKALHVTDKNIWVSGGNRASKVSIEDKMSDEWITAFEFRQLAQDGPYQREIVSQTHLSSALVAPGAIDLVASFDANHWRETVATHHPAENLTWRQFREALRTGHQLEPDRTQYALPFVSFSQRHAGFFGFHSIASLSSRVIRDRDLDLIDFSVLSGTERVACFEAWQEGHSDEDYSDDPLSFGVRLRVRTKFICRVCQDMRRAFAIRTVENRFLLQDYKPHPAESSCYKSIRVWPVEIMEPD